MKYKLIQEYPTAPALGTVIEYDEETGVYCNREIGYFLSKSEIDRFPQFWLDADSTSWCDKNGKIKRYTNFKLDRLVKHHNKDLEAYCETGIVFLLTLERPVDFDASLVRANYIANASDTFNEFSRVVSPNHIEMVITLNGPDDWKNVEFFDLKYFPKI